MKLVIGLVGLLIICVIGSTFRWLRGERFMPESKGEPRSLHEFVEQRRAANKADKNSN